MSTQFDGRLRVVNVVNLRAMCEEVSGIAVDQYKVTQVSRSRVHVTLSDIYMMDEHGVEEHSAQVTAVFPCYPGEEVPQSENPRVVLEPLRFIGVDARFKARAIDPYPLFEPLFDCPRLFLDPSGLWVREEKRVQLEPEVVRAIRLAKEFLEELREGTMEDGGWREVNETIADLDSLIRYGKVV